MYHLLYGFYKYLTKKEEYCVLILGLDNAGKTVLDRFIRPSPEKIKTSEFQIPNTFCCCVFEIHNNKYIKNLKFRIWNFFRTYLESTKTKFTKNYKAMNLAKITTTVGLNIGTITVQSVKLNFWDLGGQLELQSLWDKYYQESHAIIYVIDSNDRDRMEESRQVFDKMIKNELISGIPLLILANKQDLPDCMGVREIKPVFRHAAIDIGRRDCLTIPISALTGEGVDEGINWLVQAIKRNSLVRPPREND